MNINELVESDGVLISIEMRGKFLQKGNYLQTVLDYREGLMGDLGGFGIDFRGETSVSSSSSSAKLHLILASIQYLLN
jgi:hypothetical protein